MHTSEIIWRERASQKRHNLTLARIALARVESGQSRTKNAEPDWTGRITPAAPGFGIEPYQAAVESAEKALDELTDECLRAGCSLDWIRTEIAPRPTTPFPPRAARHEITADSMVISTPRSASQPHDERLNSPTPIELDSHRPYGLPSVDNHTLATVPYSPTKVASGVPAAGCDPLLNGLPIAIIWLRSRSSEALRARRALEACGSMVSGSVVEAVTPQQDGIFAASTEEREAKAVEMALRPALSFRLWRYTRRAEGNSKVEVVMTNASSR